MKQRGENESVAGAELPGGDDAVTEGRTLLPFFFSAFGPTSTPYLNAREAKESGRCF